MDLADIARDDSNEDEARTLNEESSESNKEARIAARRKRVLMKIEAQKRAAQGQQATELESKDDPEQNRTSLKQIKKTEERLEKLITDGNTLVTNVKVAGDSKEVARRQEGDEAKKARNERLEAEVTAGAERFEEITRKWSRAKQMTIPQVLQALFHQQKEGCSALVDEKDKLIGELQQELKAKDDQYVKHLKKQAEDIDLILERMEEQSKTLFKSYNEELAEIEKSFEDERRRLVESQKEEWDRATMERSEKERFYLEDREKRIEKNEQEIQHLRVRNAEDSNRVKIKLETDIQSLQQQIQQMKATFQLNAEKLEYNFQVLKKRDEENMVTISLQKRRLTRLQDTLNNLRAKLTKQEKACKAEMQLLMDEYRKNTEQYRELMKKVKHFQAVDSRRFHDVWAMNEEKVRKLAGEVESVDETIHRQQLGLDWEGAPAVESPLARVFAKRQAGKSISKATMYASQIISDTGSEASVMSELQVKDSASSIQTLYSPVLIKQVLEMLCSECEFLIESKLLRLLAPLDKDEQLMMKLDSIFKAIGVETEEDIHHLVKYFVDKPTSTPQDQEEKPIDSAPSIIHPNDVFSHLCSFVNDRDKGVGTSTPFLSKGLTAGNYNELLDGTFWTQMTGVLSPQRERVWTALLDGLEKYHTILQSRASLIGDTDSLRQQNTELRLLLHQYMHARVNQELEIPPTLVLPIPVEPSMI